MLHTGQSSKKDLHKLIHSQPSQDQLLRAFCRHNPIYADFYCWLEHQTQPLQYPLKWEEYIVSKSAHFPYIELRRWKHD